MIIARRNYLLSLSIIPILLLIMLLTTITIPTIHAEAIPTSTLPKPTSSCTIFTVALGDTVFYGNNEDYTQRTLRLWYIPAQNLSTIEGEVSIYGGVYIGFHNDEHGRLYPNICGGMNEHGLIFDINGLPSLPLQDNPNGSTFYTNHSIHIHASLWDCKTVDEVITWYQTHKWDATIGGQIHYADASGDAVVISVNPSTNTWAYTRKTGHFIVSTNFNLNDSSNRYYDPYNRYKTASQMLSQIHHEANLTVQACADILYAVHREGECHTLYSNIFDPVHLDVYFNYGENYQHQKRIHLPDMLNQPHTFEELNATQITGVDSHLLIKTEKIDEDFYTPAIDPLLLTVYAATLAVSTISLALVVYIHRRRKTKLSN